MAPVALLDLRAAYTNSEVKMTWRFPSNAPDSVHIYAAKRRGEQLELDVRTHIVKRLSDCIGGLSFKPHNVFGSDVKKIEYCVYLSDYNEPYPDLQLLGKMGDCFVSVIAGHAEITCQIKNKSCGDGLNETQITLDSSAEIDTGILGYSYKFNGMEITLAFPGIIHAGIFVFPPIYLVDDADPEIKVVAGINGDIHIRNMKIPFWKRLLARLFQKSR